MIAMDAQCMYLGNTLYIAVYMQLSILLLESVCMYIILLSPEIYNE